MIQSYKQLNIHDSSNIFNYQTISSKLDQCEQAFVVPKSSDSSDVHSFQDTSFFAHELKL